MPVGLLGEVMQIIFVFGVYNYVVTEVVEYDDIPIKLLPGDQEIPPVEPTLYTDRDVGTRDPFDKSSDWEDLEPDPLPAPPSPPDSHIRVTFGWIAERVQGSPIHYRAKAVKEVKTDGTPGSTAPSGGAK